MRKVTAGLFSSIDGVVEAPNEWQPAFEKEMGAVLSRMLEEQDAVLLGRVTFTEWAGYWPTRTDEPFASYINSTQKYVASTTLGDRRPVAEQHADQGFGGRLPCGAASARRRDNRDFRRPSLVRSLIEQGLLDELTLMISPVVAGGSRKRLFADDAALTKFELVHAQPTSSEALISRDPQAR